MSINTMGNFYYRKDYRKKPFYKKGAFWLIIIIILGIYVFANPSSLSELQSKILDLKETTKSTSSDPAMSKGSGYKIEIKGFEKDAECEAGLIGEPFTCEIIRMDLIGTSGSSVNLKLTDLAIVYYDTGQQDRSFIGYFGSGGGLPDECADVIITNSAGGFTLFEGAKIPVSFCFHPIDRNRNPILNIEVTKDAELEYGNDPIFPTGLKGGSTREHRFDLNEIAL